jgi:hypothetical protein
MALESFDNRIDITQLSLEQPEMKPFAVSELVDTQKWAQIETYIENRAADKIGEIYKAWLINSSKAKEIWLGDHVKRTLAAQVKKEQREHNSYGDIAWVDTARLKQIAPEYAEQTALTRQQCEDIEDGLDELPLNEHLEKLALIKTLNIPGQVELLNSIDPQPIKLDLMGLAHNIMKLGRRSEHPDWTIISEMLANFRVVFPDHLSFSDFEPSFQRQMQQILVDCANAINSDMKIEAIPKFLDNAAHYQILSAQRLIVTNGIIQLQNREAPTPSSISELPEIKNF